MFNPFISAIVFFIEMLIAFLFYSGISLRRHTSVVTFLAGLFLYSFCFAVNWYYGNTPWFNIAIFTLVNFVYSISCFHISLNTCFFYAITLSVLCCGTEYIVILPISILTNNAFLSHRDNISLMILEYPLCKTLYFITCLFLSKITNRNSKDAKLSPAILLFPINTVISLLVLGYIDITNVLPEQSRYYIMIASFFQLVATVILFLAHQFQAEKEAQFSKMANENARLQLEKAYYDILEQQNQQLMIYVHDTKNHLAAIRSLNTDPEIEQYVGKLSERLTWYSRNCHSGNKLLDVMISKYSFECERKGIHFEYDVKICNLDNMDDIDLVAVLGNLMDNALTATERSQLRKISLVTAKRNSYSIIIISNSYDAPPNMIAGNLVTTKADREHHGYGLKSVKKTLKKYGGDFEWNYDETSHTFTVTVMVGEATDI